jgi:hypothetical protein
MNKETLRMQMLAGIITESQYKAKLNEDENAPDWDDYEGYELTLEDYFNTYDLEDPQTFKDEVYSGGNWDSVNNLAYDIAKRAGFKGDLNDLLDSENEEFNSYCNTLAHHFMLRYAADMGIVDRNDPEYQKEFKENDREIDSFGDKFDNISAESFN